VGSVREEAPTGAAADVEAEVSAVLTDAAEPERPAPAEPAAPSEFEHFRSLCELLPDHILRLEKRLAEHLAATASCSRAAFDHLYEEMQGYKQNFLTQAQRPLLMDLIFLYDSVQTLRREYADVQEAGGSILRDHLSALHAEAEEILARAGVERMVDTPDKLDARLQQAVRTEPTDLAEEHLAVIQRLKAGFLCGERPMRKEMVVVKKYSRPAGRAEPSLSAPTKAGGEVESAPETSNE
jgi:molecular chaperone GrpE (heat shock protein)